MNEEDFRDIGRQIQQSMQKAVHSQEFNDIKATIKNTAKEIQNAFQTGFQPEVRQPGPPMAPARPQPPMAPVRPVSREKAPRDRIPGRAAAILTTVFGALGLGLVFAAALAGGILALTNGRLDFLAGVSLGVFAPLLLISCVLLLCGGRLRRRVKRFRLYREQLKGCSFCPIEVLASAAGQTPKFVAKDLRKMIRLGMFPDAHVDDENTCLMLDLDTYRLYQQAKLQQQEALRQEQEPPQDELGAVVVQGRRTLREIRACNDALPGEEISRKLDQLETVAGAIFEYVEKYPEKLPGIRRFMNYYLPTTLKLLNAYKQFHQQRVGGRQMQQTKEEIESALDTINQAFANLLDSLMRDDALDLSTDISVMKTLMEQEGLTGGLSGENGKDK